LRSRFLNPEKYFPPMRTFDQLTVNSFAKERTDAAFCREGLA
jgi:hypothetical protein